MSSTGSEDSGQSDFDYSSETDDLSHSSSGSSGESDLDELYESFEFEEDVPQSHLQQAPEPSCSLLPFASAVRDKQLYPGAELSTFQCYLLVFQYAIQHSLTTKAFTELLQLIAVHLPKGAATPRSVHNLKRFFVESYPELQPIRHHYCSCCQRPLPSESSICSGRGCSGGNLATFITIPAGPQLKRVLKGLICM
jgi:hypothetical protein